jgi:hypothetical protein
VDHKTKIQFQEDQEAIGSKESDARGKEGQTAQKE